MSADAVVILKKKSKNLAYGYWRAQMHSRDQELTDRLTELHAQHAELEKLNEQHTTARNKLNDEIEALKETHELELLKLDKQVAELHKKQEDESHVIDDILKIKHNIVSKAQTEANLAKMRCRDPVFKLMVQILPLTILNLLMEYNSSAICMSCFAYLPKLTHCLNQRVHRYTCVNSMPTFTSDNECFWDLDEHQKVWDDCLHALKAKPKTLGFEIEKFNVVKKADQLVSIEVSSNNHSLSIVYHTYPKKTIAFRIANKLQPRTTKTKSATLDQA